MENNNDNKGEQDSELTKLLDSSYPLLAKLRETCPGTYKHSQNLASILEGVSLLLELDVNFMKVYFSENQLEDENPHKKLDPFISCQIITRHVSDTVLFLANDENFPRRLVQVISQHHGTSIVQYFYNRSDCEIEDIFRYKCDKPKNVEAAILMICDNIEARSKSALQGNAFNPTEIIETTINDLLSDGQLDDVVMRLGDLQKIKEALAKELEGMFQKRVDYKHDQKKAGSFNHSDEF